MNRNRSTCLDQHKPISRSNKKSYVIHLWLKLTQMKLSALGVFCVVSHLCSCVLVPCGSGTKSSYSLMINETDPVGTDVQFRVEVKKNSTYWQLQLVQPASPTGLRDFYTSAFHFKPNETDRPLKCMHTSRSNFCDLKLAKMLDAEFIFAKFNSGPPLHIQFNATCGNASTVLMMTNVSMAVKLINEFPPTFTQPVVTVTFPEERLVKGFLLYSLENTTTDRDVGRQDTAVTYSVVNGTDTIAIANGSNVVLRRKLASHNFSNQFSMDFVLAASNPGRPDRNSTMTLILQVGDEDADDNGDDPGSKIDDLSTRVKLLYGIVIPVGVVVLLLTVVTCYNCKRKSAEKKKQGTQSGGLGMSLQAMPSSSHKSVASSRSASSRASKSTRKEEEDSIFYEDFDSVSNIDEAQVGKKLDEWEPTSQSEYTGSTTD